MASQSEENYLKALFHLSSGKDEVNVSELSATLGVSKPSANSMVKNLQQQGLVNYQKYKPLTLTEEGKKAAALVVRKHRLTEMYLVEKMGFGWEEVHEIAEQVEHIDSPDFFARMDEILEFPTEDPHGSPIPDAEGKVKRQLYKPLSKCNAGEKVRLGALSASSSEFLNFLNTRDISLGMWMTIQAVEAFDGSMIVSYNGHMRETLSKSVCDRLLVEEE